MSDVIDSMPFVTIMYMVIALFVLCVLMALMASPYVP